MMKRGILVAIALLFSACGANPASPDVPVRLIGYGGFVASSPGLTIIRDSSQWQAFVSQTGLRAPSFRPEDPLPAVNFPDEMAMAVFLGARPSTGYRIRVDRVARERNATIVHATEEIPCFGATVITYPLTAVAIPRTAAPAEISWSTARVAC